jgi:parallel beta-helix repeat protein
MERFGKTCLGALLSAVATIPVVVSAAESYDNCTGFIDSLPAYISSQGTWCLRKDVGTSITSGAAILIETNNVTIDCNGFKIGGLAGGPGTMAIGIHPYAGLNNTTVRNCRVRGFWLGIATEGGGGHLIESNQFDGNTEVGISVYSPNSTVRHNMVMDTGGGTATANGAQGIVVSGGVDALDNTVVGVVSNDLQADNDARGIVAVDNEMGSVVGNRIRGLVPSGAGPAFGILDFTTGYSVIRDNIVQGMGLSGSVGIKCNSASTTSRDNVIAGFDLAIDGCTSSGDSVNPN